jgi:putative zinc-binding metallo-peptidase
MHRLLALASFSIAITLTLAPARGDDKSAPDLKALGKKYGIAIETKSPAFPVQMKSGTIDGAAAAEAEIDSYAPIFAFEWSLYPPELVRATRLRKVVFCKDLSFEKQRRTAVPDFEHDVLYLDVARGRARDLYVRKVIHHEFFHVIDLRDDGKLYEDERWSKLNPPGFKYGAGGAKLQDDPKVTDPVQDEPGFLNRYAASGVEEDKAEVFAHMMVEPGLIAERARKDKYLRAKVERMKEILAEFTPKTGAAFWKAVEKAERGE